MTSPPPKKKGNIKYIKIKYVFSQKPNRTTKKKKQQQKYVRQ